MGVFGVDVSNHNPGFTDFRGWDFAFIKASEGNSFKDWLFNQHLNNARAAGCLVAAYHYQRDVSAQSQVYLIKSMVPKDVPVIIDVETGSGSLNITREIIRLLREEGYDSPLLYVPRWFWRDHLGSPSLEGLPLLWASWYPDYVARPREEGIWMVPQSAWEGYGGGRVAMMQFTSTPHDMNYYPGTRDDLARLLNGGAGGGSGDTMSATDAYNGVAAMIKDMAAGNAPDLVEALRKSLTQAPVKKAPDFVDDTSIETEVAWNADNVKRVVERLEIIEDKIDAQSTGTGYTLDQVADAVANKLYARLQS